MIPLFPVDEPCPVCRKVCLDSFGEHAVHCKELPGFKYMHDLVRDVLYDVLKRAGISSKKEAPVNFLTDPLEGRSTLRSTDILVFGWAGGKHACVDLTGVSPLVGLRDNGFVAGQAALKAESSKVAKHEKACREKTEYLRCDFGNVEIAHNEEVDIRIGDKILQPKESFRYLGSMLHKSRRIDEELSAVIKAAWIEVGAITGECWPITKALANRVEVAELRMLKWTCGRTLSNMIPNGVYRAELEVENIINKMREGRLRWFGHVRRRPQSAPVRRVEALVVDGLRRRGRPKLRWEDRVKQDLKELRLSVDMTSDRNDWRARIRLGG
ncbi:hypothetical protein Tco_0704545 [Tanacetum coccineum]|uniref:Reverse transcriptase n=1 Tax=Tanacetum coccineum TaxID=301880 RepID=A0ABQ4Y2D3_9ASTR